MGRIQAIRNRILANAEDRNWAIDRDRLDDRHIVRRMVLKRCVYGVDSVRFGPKTVGEIVRAAVLELTYTAHDMAPFARDMGHVDVGGAVLPPYVWDAERRLRLRAKLDAVFFHLYGVTDRDDVRYHCCPVN